MAGACRSAGIAVAVDAGCSLGARDPGWYIAISEPGPAPVGLRPSRAPCIWPSKELCGDRWSELADPADDARGLWTAALRTDTRLLAESPAGSAALMASRVAFELLRGAGWTSASPSCWMLLTDATNMLCTAASCEPPALAACSCVPPPAPSGGTLCGLGPTPELSACNLFG